MTDCLTDVRQNLAAPRLLGKNEGGANLTELLNTTMASILDQIKSVLANLQVSVGHLWGVSLVGDSNVIIYIILMYAERDCSPSQTTLFEAYFILFVLHLSVLHYSLYSQNLV